jgi:geranylgeranylglycerol-phosphate geranylgeranyltransferase
MGYLEIIRPVNCIIAFASVLVGAWIGKGITISPQLLLAGMILFLIYAFGNIVNDLFDIEIDRINRPERPLPSGKVDRRYVMILAIFFFVIAVIFSISLGAAVFLLVLGICIVSFLYDMHFKKTVLGNAIVSLITGLGFILGGIVVGNPACIFPFIFSLFVHMPREIIKDIIDIKGDRLHGVVSLPILLGAKKSLNISALFLTVLCILLPLPFIMRILHLRYMLILLIGAYPLLIYTIITFLKNPDTSVLRKSSRVLKISMAIGLAAMII